MDFSALGATYFQINRLDSAEYFTSTLGIQTYFFEADQDCAQDISIEI